MYVLLAGLFSATAVVYYFINAYKYWKRRGVPHLEPTIPYGNSDSFLIRGLGYGMKSKIYYDEIKARGWRFGGIYAATRPLLVIADPVLVKSVMSKDFQHFVDRGTFHNEKDDPLSANLFNIGGTKWRNLRTKLTPTFTSGKMKTMFNTVLDCCRNLAEALETSADGGAVDFKELASCFTTDVIGSCAFGIECNSFKNPDAEFRKNGRELLDPPRYRLYISFVCMAFPKLAKAIGLSSRSGRISEFFKTAVEDAVTFREQSLRTRNDFLQLMIELKNSGQQITMDDIAAQSFIFFVAGFETSSTTLTYCIYELAKNRGIQEKVRKEVAAVVENHGEKLTYEGLSEMKYTRQVIDETLRKYPPVPTLNRDCTSDYKIPDSDVTLEKGVGILIPAYGLHHDPEYFPNPETFDPERFSDENKATIVPFTYLPFGDGPRNCIGLRFGLMQTTMGLATLLRKYRFSVNEKTPDPIRMDQRSFLLFSLDRIWLDVERV